MKITGNAKENGRKTDSIYKRNRLKSV